MLIRALFVSMSLCVVIAPFWGTFFVGLLSGSPFLVVSADIAGVPVLAYAYFAAAPIGFIAACLATLWAAVLFWKPGPVRSMWQWIRLGLAAGFVTSLVAAAGFMVARFGWPSTSMVVFGGAAVLTGSLCGMLLGAYARLEDLH